MALIEDVNNKLGQHAAKNEYWESAGEKVVRCHLPYGDYQRPAPVVVDTKRDLVEIAANVSGDHERFKRAAVLARDMGSRLVILVENEEGVRDLAGLARWTEPAESWAKRRANGAKRRYEGERLAKACATMSRRYGLEFAFCSPEEAGRRVVELLDGKEGCRDGRVDA